MGLHPTAQGYAKTILARLPRAGPATLQEIYGFCGALDGGSQHFVRQAVSQLAGDCKIRRIAQGIYGALANAEPQAETVADPPPEPAAAQAAADTHVVTSTPDADDDRPADTIEEPPAIAATVEQPDTEEETETMQTQTNGSNGHASNKGTAALKRPQPLQDFIITLLGASDKPMSIEAIAKAALKKGVTRSNGSVSTTLQKLFASKTLSRPETGMYAGAQVLYDAGAKRTAKKASAAAKKLAEMRSAKQEKRVAAPAKKKPAPVKAKPAIQTAKSGRKPSIFRPVYDELDQKLAKAKADEKAAASGITEVDAQIESLKVKRADFVATRDAARVTGKKLGDSRKRIAEVEAGVAASLKA